MTFDNYLDQAWTDHATKADKVASEFNHGLKLIETNKQLADFAWLVTHTMGEHLGRWTDGITFITSLKSHRAFVKDSDTDAAIQRYMAALHIAKGSNSDLTAFSNSEQVRIYALAASALSTSNVDRAQSLLKKALTLAETQIEKKDPANKSLAVTGNNLACALEEKKSRSTEETELMIFAAQTGRKFWEIAGTWLEVSRAEYRLAMSYLQAEDLPLALLHAQTCVELCRENKAEDLDMFYAYEALAQVERQRKNDLGFKAAAENAGQYFAKLNESDQKWCTSSLEKLK